MHKLIFNRFTVWIMSILLLAGAAIIAAFFYISTMKMDVLTAYFTQQIHDQTGVKITLSAPVHIEYFPQFSLKISDAQIQIPADPALDIHLSDTHIGLHFFALLRGKIDAANVTGHIHLAHQKQNWRAETSFQSQVNGSISQQKLNLSRCQIALNIQYNQQVTAISMNGEAALDLIKDQLKLSHFEGKIDGINVAGNLSVSHFSRDFFARGGLEIKSRNTEFFTRKWLTPNNFPLVLRDINSRMQFKIRPQSVNVTGILSAQNLHADGLNLQNLDANFQLQNGIISLKTFTADLYRGTLHAAGSIAIDTPHTLALQGNYDNIQSDALLYDIIGRRQKIRFNGSANGKFTLTSSGISTQQLIQNLAGRVEFNFRDGMFNNGLSNRYQSISGNGTIARGILETHELKIVTSQLVFSGNTKIDMVNGDISYRAPLAAEPG